MIYKWFVTLHQFAAFRTSFSIVTQVMQMVCYITLYMFAFSEPVQISSPIELFQWLPKEHMCVLVYLVRFIC